MDEGHKRAWGGVGNAPRFQPQPHVKYQHNQDVNVVIDHHRRDLDHYHDAVLPLWGMATLRRRTATVRRFRSQRPEHSFSTANFRLHLIADIVRPRRNFYFENLRLLSPKLRNEGGIGLSSLINVPIDVSDALMCSVEHTRGRKQRRNASPNCQKLDEKLTFGSDRN